NHLHHGRAVDFGRLPLSVLPPRSDIYHDAISFLRRLLGGLPVFITPYKGKKSRAFQEKWLRHIKSLKRDTLKCRDRRITCHGGRLRRFTDWGLRANNRRLA